MAPLLVATLTRLLAAGVATTALAATADAAASSVKTNGVPVTVQTEEGPVVGLVNGSEPTRDCAGMSSFPGVPDVTEFLGIPYATAPIGELRWRPPKAAPRHTEPFEATKPGGVCPQAPMSQLAEKWPMWLPGWSFDEDCLNLNVWTPSLTANGTATSLLPVVVFIHGGGFAGGNGYTQGGCPFYNGMPIAALESIVVVTINYRLGTFGFLDLPELQAESGTAGNYGLQDQRLALQWVQRNIAAFGGDPRRVTIMGESAGGASVLYHAVLPRSQGLFSKVIAQSGYDMTKQPQGEGPMSGPQYGRVVQKDLGCAAGPARTAGEREDLLACLRKATARQVLEAQDRYLNARSLVETELTFAPVADGYEMPVGSSLLAEYQKKPPRVPLMIGSNLNETSLFICSDLKDDISADRADGARLELAMYLGINLTKQESQQLTTLYPVGEGGYPSYRSSVIGESTDMMFSCAAESVADMVSAVPGASVYRYVLARSPHLLRLVSKCYGVPHVADTLYNFLGVGLPAKTPALFDDGDKVLLKVMTEAWWSFVRSGVPSLPSGTAVGSWPRYDATQRAMLRLDAEVTVESGFHAHECAAMPRTGRDSPRAAAVENARAADAARSPEVGAGSFEYV